MREIPEANVIGKSDNDFDPMLKRLIDEANSYSTVEYINSLQESQKSTKKLQENIAKGIRGGEEDALFESEKEGRIDENHPDFEKASKEDTAVVVVIDEEREEDER